MKVVKVIASVVLIGVLAFAGFILYSQLTWYNPPQSLSLYENEKPDTIRCSTVLQVLSWNLGYAGLGDDMDFFYDGGKEVRGTYERTLQNLDSIRSFIRSRKSDTFILTQEVDLNSKRSYHLNELDTLTFRSQYHAALAPNYVVGFVPIPPASPMGKVNSGIMTLSRYLPESSTRYGYPGMFDWPVRLFNLRRCMLVDRFPTSNGKDFLLINTHMSAFDDGSLKKQEMQYLKEFVLAEYAKGNYVIVGGDWNQSPPGFPLTKFGENYQSESFLLNNIADDFVPRDWKWAFDSFSPTNRYLNEAYMPGRTFRCLIDFFLVSPNIEVMENTTFDLNFRNSDHNPIEMKFKLLE